MRIISRAEWGANHGDGGQPMKAPVGHVVIHHTFRPNLLEGLTDGTVFLFARSIESYHVRENLWSAIGYNWLIDPDGRIIEGRGWRRIGAHTPGLNSISIGIAFMIDGSRREPTVAAWKAASDLIREAIRRGDLDPAYKLTGHRDHRETSCPGDKVYAELGRLRGLTVPKAEEPKHVGRIVKSPTLGPLVVTRYEDDRAWWFIPVRDLPALPATKAGTPLSKIPT